MGGRCVRGWNGLEEMKRRKRMDEWVNERRNISINPLTPMSDQDRISPYSINTISTR